MANPAVINTFDLSPAESVTYFGQHLSAWTGSTWCLITTAVTGLVAITLLARRLVSDAARIGLILYAIGTTLILAGQTFELTVTRPLLGAAAPPDWWIGVQSWPEGLDTAYFALLAPGAMAVVGVEMLRLRRCPIWWAVVFLVAAAANLGQFVSFHAALPFPVFLAFVAVGVAMVARRSVRTPVGVLIGEKS